MTATVAAAKRARAIDVALAVLVMVAAYLVSVDHLRANYRVAPAIEDLTVACTGKPGWIPHPALLYKRPEWIAMIERRTDSFPCEAAAGIELVQVGTTWQLQEYFHRALSSWFRIVGPRVDGFMTFQAGMYALTCAMAFVIFRIGLPKLIALACTAAFMYSASHLAAVGLPIEYAKAPWILAIVGLSAVIVRRDAADRSLAWPSLALGLAGGIGIGFKPDVLAALPLAIATPLLFVRWGAGRPLSRKLGSLALILCGIALTGAPMIYRNFFAATGSLLPVQLLGGQDFETESLYAIRPLYDYGLVYNDSHITWLINSYGQRVLGKTAVSAFFSREMQEMATSLLTGLWTTFPADLLLRVIAGTIRVIQLSGMPIAVSLAGLLIVFARTLRGGWFVTFVIVYLSAYVSLVFQRRHIFHLEAMSWFLLGVVVTAAWTGGLTLFRRAREGRLGAAMREGWPGVRRRVVVAALALLAIGVSIAVMLAAARLYQQAIVTELVARYQAAPREPRAFTIDQRGEHDVTVRTAGISLRDRAISPSALPPAADYLIVTFGCASDKPIAVAMKYFAPLEDWSNWNRQFDVVCAAGTESTLMVPVYQYDTAYVFDGLVMAGADAASVRSVSTMRADSTVRLWLNLLIPSDWRSRPWYELLKMPPVMPI